MKTLQIKRIKLKYIKLTQISAQSFKHHMMSCVSSPPTSIKSTSAKLKAYGQCFHMNKIHIPKTDDKFSQEIP